MGGRLTGWECERRLNPLHPSADVPALVLGQADFTIEEARRCVCDTEIRTLTELRCLDKMISYAISFFGMSSESPKLTTCRFKLPLAYNDGKPVDEARREVILDRIFVVFGGWTDEGVERGAYRRSDTGQKQVEHTLKIRVDVNGPQEVERLREMVSEIGGELDQETMHFEVSTGSHVELVPSKKKGDRS
jgi:hypothetical protein